MPAPESPEIHSQAALIRKQQNGATNSERPKNMKLPVHDDRPGLWRLGPAASKAGLSADTFAAASEAGTIPVRVIKLGPRSRYVPAAEFKAWLETLNSRKETE